jgi:hypothetical protein
MTVIDRKFLHKEYPQVRVRQTVPIDIKGVGKGREQSEEFATVTMYVPGFKGDKAVLGAITREFHIVEDLGCNALIGNDVLAPEGFVVDPGRRRATIRSCDNMVLPLKVLKRPQVIEHRFVRTARATVVPPHSKRLVPVRVNLPEGTDYRFNPYFTRSSAHLAVSGIFPEAVIDSKTTAVAYYNNSERSIKIPANARIGEVIEWDYNDRATPEEEKTVDCFFSVARVLPTMAFALHTGLTAFRYSTPTPSDVNDNEAAPFSSEQTSCFHVAPDELSTEPNLYDTLHGTSADAFSLLPPLDERQGDPSKFGAGAIHLNETDDITAAQIKGLKQVLGDYPSLWEDRIGRVVEPEKDWLQIPLKDGAVIQSKGPYRVSKRDQGIIDDTFDRARKDGRMAQGEGVIPVGWPVFVVWANGKGRPVVDLRGLNANVVQDAYPLPLQAEIFNLLRGMSFISVFDLQKAFYQRQVAKKDRWKLAVVTHRGQEIFNVAPMGYCGSPSHMQKFMDKILAPHKEYARCYIDDVVIFSKNYEQHIIHLRRVLNCLSAAGMTLSPDKCYVGFHSVQLLGRMVDRYGLSTVQEKTAAIAQIPFPNTLRDLEQFLGIANYYRDFIARFSAIVDALQSLKTRLLRGCPRQGKLRDAYTRSKRIINPSDIERASFQAAKDILCSDRVLYHLDPDLPLLYYVDSSHEWGFAIAVHQVPRDVMREYGLALEDIVNGNYDRKLERPIMYLSRKLNRYEMNYWSTELEIAGIVWAVQKTRHFIEGNKHIKFYTDHKPAEDVFVSTQLRTTASARQNLRLTRASQFLSQYPNVKIIYRPGKDHVNADVLSRLSRLRSDAEIHEEETMTEGIYGFKVRAQVATYVASTTVVGISPDLLDRLVTGYRKDPHFATIYKAIHERMLKKGFTINEEIPPAKILPSDIFEKLDRLAPEDVEYVGFQGRACHGRLLLYIKDSVDGHPRLCIPSNCHEEFLRSAHEGSTHAGYERVYKRLRPNYYMKNLSTLVRRYTQSCPQCQRNNPVRHKPHGQLQPLEVPAGPCETVTLDLVVKLPVCKSRGIDYDSLMTITDKLTKMVTVFPGREDWPAHEWASAFFEHYYRRWGVPCRIISDRGKVFMSEFWTAVFRICRADLLVSTSYHPQTDGQSERTNQTVEIALRHLCSPSKDDWVHHLPEMEFTMNNLANASTGKSPVQLLMGMDLRTPLDWASLHPERPDVTEWVTNREKYRREATDALAFARTKMAIYYDAKHKPGDKAYITLAKGIEPGYRIPTPSSKLSERRVGPFPIIRAVGRLAYELQLPSTWTIHPVISVAHLEPHKPDPFNRESDPPPPEIVRDDDDDDEGHPEYEVEAILAKRYNKRKRRDEWRVKWKGYGPEQNTWEPQDHLQNALTRLEQFENKGNPVNFVTTLFQPPVASPVRLPYYKTNLISRR